MYALIQNMSGFNDAPFDAKEALYKQSSCHECLPLPKTHGKRRACFTMLTVQTGACVYFKTNNRVKGIIIAIASFTLESPVL